VREITIQELIDDELDKITYPIKEVTEETFE
jgi:hypothetical protein